MFKAIKTTLLPALVLMIAFNAAGATWIDGNADNDWYNPDNWDTATVPTALDPVTIQAGAVDYPIITGYESDPCQADAAGLTVTGGEITVGSFATLDLSSGAAGSKVIMTGGQVIIDPNGVLFSAGESKVTAATMNIYGFFKVGLPTTKNFKVGDIADSANGIVNVSNGGYLAVGRSTLIGNNSPGVINVNGGSIEGFNWIRISKGSGTAGSELNLYSGDIYSSGLFDISAVSHEQGTFNQSGGTMSCANFEIFDNGTANISGGEFEARGTTSIGAKDSFTPVAGSILNISGSGEFKTRGGFDIYEGAEINVTGGELKFYGDVTFLDSTAKINFSGGRLRWDGNRVEEFSDFYINGDIAADGLVDIYFKPDRDPGTDDDDTYMEIQSYGPGQAKHKAPLPYKIFEVTEKAAEPTTTLEWFAPDNGADEYDLYTGLDPDNLTYVTTTTGLSHVIATPGPGETLYWRVDAIKNSVTEPGLVWQFSVRGTMIISDFEDATTSDWKPYLIGDYGDSGTVLYSVALYEDDVDGEIAIDDYSLKFGYDNIGSGFEFSEVYCDPTAMGKGDWNYGDLSMLVVNFHGTRENDYQDFYVRIEDTGTGSYEWIYNDPNPDPNVNQYLWDPSWRTMYIDLQEASGTVNLDSIDKLAIGVKNKAGYPDDAGSMIIDEIYISVPDCVASKVPGDFDGDCDADFDDFAELAYDWARTGETVSASPSEPVDYIVYYDFEPANIFNAVTSSDGVYDVTNPGDPAYAAVFIQDGNGTENGNQSYASSGGVNDSGTLVLDDTSEDIDGVGLGLGVEVLSPELGTLTDEVTISMWIQGDTDVPDDDMLFVSWEETLQGVVHKLRTTGPNADGVFNFQAGGDDPADWYQEDYVIGYASKNEREFKHQWNHYAFTRAADGTQKLFINGLCVAERFDNDGDLTGITHFAIGGRPGEDDGTGIFYRNRDSWAYSGMIDEFKVYDRALSQAEVIRLALGTGGSVEQPALIDTDTDGDGQTDIDDLAEMAKIWAQGDQLWPVLP